MKSRPRRALPQLEIAKGMNHSPHVVILGAGASRACCPEGDKTGKPLPVMSDFVGKLGIAEILENAGYGSSGNFEEIYSKIHESQDHETLQCLEDVVRNYFSDIELIDAPNLYDYLILSLRSKDLIVTFNWDPLLPQAYRRWRHLGDVLPQIAFLHGNVDVSADVVGRRTKFTCDLTGQDGVFEPSQLLYPVGKKDYSSDPFIQAQWDLALSCLERAYYVTVYGYSAPKTDVEARQLLLQAWQENPTQTLAEFDVVDIADRHLVKASWSEFMVGTHGGIMRSFENNILKKHPRRTCEAFAFATLQQTPWHEDPFPEANTLEELENWVRPLLAEEISDKLGGKPHH